MPNHIVIHFSINEDVDEFEAITCETHTFTTFKSTWMLHT
jgi:hypothetical protein